MKTSADIRNNAANYAATQHNSGFIRFYDGTRPTDPDTALSGNTELAECTFGATAFGAAVAGVVTANAITKDSSATGGSTATFARSFASDGTTALHDFRVSTSGGGGEIIMGTLTIGAGVEVTVDSCTLEPSPQGS